MVLSLHTGDLTPTSLITQDTKLGEFDGAIACTDDSEWQDSLMTLNKLTLLNSEILSRAHQDNSAYSSLFD